MDNESHYRIPKKWVRTALIVGVTSLIVAPLTALASHSFIDVPDSNTFHEDIAWLADAGVTQGCNPPDNTEFCPDDPVTRGQMSAFMRRFAQYLDAEDGTPSQAENATSLNAKTSSFYERPIAMKTGTGFNNTHMQEQNGEIANVSISAPEVGSIIVRHTTSWLSTSEDYTVILWMEPRNPDALCDSRLDSDETIPGTWVVESGVLGDAPQATASGAGYVSVDPGEKTYSLCLETFQGTSNNGEWSIEAAWYPAEAADTTSPEGTEASDASNESAMTS